MNENVAIYEYNSLKQLQIKSTPDGGTTLYYYDAVGRMRFSQNQTQLDAGEMSYTKYDHLSRVVEVGDSTLPGDVSAAVDDQSRPTNGQHRVLTFYTTPADSTATGLTHNGRYVDWTPQRYTQNRIAHVYTDDGVHTQYSYDPHGNVEWVRQEIPELGTNYVRYEYDLISGNMLRMLYDEGWEDQYIQRYRYDEDNRLREVESSRDGEIYESDARYTYYAHGPLRRVEYGEDSVQGIDYTYTLQGWLKAINHPSLDTSAGVDVDPGSDGFGTRRWFAPDAFGMMLGYYDGDFVHGNSPFASGSSVPASSYHLQPSYDLYNGNIGSWTTNIQPSGASGKADEQLVGYTYRYDVLNRLLEANYHTYGSGGIWTGSLSEYTSSYTYDPNGNILTLDRGGDTTGAGAMDKLTYAYYGGTNQLRQVSDLVSATKYSEDIDSQSDTSNYTYDAIGNMIGDVSENITNIEWSIYGKVLSVEKNNVTVLRFTYDAAGNRVRKEVIDPTDTTQVRSTYYVYEAGGKVVAIYENCVDPEPSPHEGVDTDNDGIPDQCDPDPMNPSVPPPGGDIDGDGVPDAVDPCPCTAGPAGDQDSDGIPDGTDPNPCAPNCTEAFHLAEWVIYGNGAQGRIAETKPTDLARPAGEGTAIDTTNEYHVRVLSEKYYELKDHLGNVRVVVTDMKEPTVQSGTYPFVAVVSSYANYYAYGMLQPGRSWEGGEWRYGFNGKEMDDEWSGKGNVYDYGARMYDARVARFLTVDPLSHQFVWWTPYQFAGDMPVRMIDLDGLEPSDPGTYNGQGAYAPVQGSGSDTDVAWIWRVPPPANTNLHPLLIDLGPGATAHWVQQTEGVIVTANEISQIFPDAPIENVRVIESEITIHGGSVLTTRNRLAHFVAQSGHESNQFRNFAEATNYSKKGAKAAWSSKAAEIERRWDEDFAGNGEALFNYVYCCKYGNGDEASGDGYRYRGGGIFQLTWESNYAAFNGSTFNFSAVDVVRNPDLLRTDLRVGVDAALWYFNARVGADADVGGRRGSDAVSSDINQQARSTFGVRYRYYARALEVLHE